MLAFNENPSLLCIIKSHKLNSKTMKAETFAKRTSKVSTKGSAYSNVRALLLGTVEEIRPTWYNGTGKRTTIYDTSSETRSILKAVGLVEGKDFVFGNDAARGGASGNFFRLTPAGKRKRIK